MYTEPRCQDKIEGHRLCDEAAKQAEHYVVCASDHFDEQMKLAFSIF